MSALPDIAFSLVLMFSALFAALIARRARAFARDALRFAAALYVALACADLAAAATSEMSIAFLANTVALFVSALAPVALAIALFAAQARPPHAVLSTLLLCLAAVAGLVAAMTNVSLFAFVPLFVSVCAMLAVAARVWRLTSRPMLPAAAGALTLLLGASASMTGGASGRTALALFSAAGLLGIALSATQRSGQRSGNFVEDEVVETLRPTLISRLR